MDAPIRVRFAPSPTGYLHIGGARTALFNWLFARHHGGTFILRIEDTDTQRNSQEAIDVILRGLSWLGLDWDEGPTSGDPDAPGRGGRGPYFQSRRGAIYARRIQELRDKGLAYDRDGAVFFRMSREAVTIPDLIIGDVHRPLTDREEADPDWVLVRSDGTPVFHLVNVVDDLEMGITHVIRGEDHLANTAKHLALFRAFGVEPPKYAHIPLILNPDGSKMSKRDHGAHVTNYEDDGFTPEAVLNYLALLGWSPADGKEFLPVPELVARFGLDRVNRSPAKFDVKKLEALHFEHTRTLAPARFVELRRRRPRDGPREGQALQRLARLRGLLLRPRRRGAGRARDPGQGTGRFGQGPTRKIVGGLRGAGGLQGRPVGGFPQGPGRRTRGQGRCPRATRPRRLHRQVGWPQPLPSARSAGPRPRPAPLRRRPRQPAGGLKARRREPRRDSRPGTPAGGALADWLGVARVSELKTK